MVEIYRSITICKPGDGRTLLFWKDFWIGDTLLADKFPRLFSFVEQTDISVHAMLAAQEAHTLFYTPLSLEAFQEYQEMQLFCNGQREHLHEADSRNFAWGKSTYASTDFYKYMFQCLPNDSLLNNLWKSRCLPKLKVFCWLLIKGRLNTKDMMLRKH